MHGDRRLGQQQARFKHRGARRNVRPADLAAHLMKEGHRTPVGQDLITSHRVGQIGAAGREHGLRPLPQGPELDGPGGFAREGTGGRAEPGGQQAGGEDPVARAHAAGQGQPAPIHVVGQERLHCSHTATASRKRPSLPWVPAPGAGLILHRIWLDAFAALIRTHASRTCREHPEEVWHIWACGSLDLMFAILYRHS